MLTQPTSSRAYIACCYCIDVLSCVRVNACRPELDVKPEVHVTHSGSQCGLHNLEESFSILGFVELLPPRHLANCSFGSSASTPVQVTVTMVFKNVRTMRRFKITLDVCYCAPYIKRVTHTGTFGHIQGVSNVDVFSWPRNLMHPATWSSSVTHAWHTSVVYCSMTCCSLECIFYHVCR